MSVRPRSPRKRTTLHTPQAPAVEISVETPLWASHPGVKTMVRRAIAEAAAKVATVRGEVSIVLTSDAAIRALNRTWRRKDAPTNVLSFPAPFFTASAASPASRRARAAAPPDPRGAGGTAAPPAATAGGGKRPPRHFGDVVIAYETAAREAVAEGKSLRNHVAHLAVHGFLHLLGYDHETDAEAAAMEQLEVAVLKRLAVSDPYVARGAKG
jgi:probable rRNA maturation factor